MRVVWGLHTEDCACWNGLFIYPEGHLGEDHCHYAGDICLNHEVAHFTFQVEVDCHHHIFTCRINRKELVSATKHLKLQKWQVWLNTASDRKKNHCIYISGSQSIFAETETSVPFNCLLLLWWMVIYVYWKGLRHSKMFAAPDMKRLSTAPRSF